jgi:hypothetical protein
MATATCGVVCRAAFVWLNSPVVREAIHAEPVDRIGEWTICSDRILYVSRVSGGGGG